MRSSVATRFRGDAVIPGDKSISHRALLLSSQRLGVTRIHGLLAGDDVLRTAAALRLLGVNIAQGTDHVWQVQGVGIGGLQESHGVLDMGNSGTGARLLMGLVSPYPFTTFFTGDDSLRSRPMKRVMEPLGQMGVEFVAREGGRLPLAVSGHEDMLPIEYRLPVASAQVKSAVLLAGLNTPGTTVVIEPEPTRDHSENMLSHMGFCIDSATQPGGAMRIALTGQVQPPPGDLRIDVPADPSSAAFPLVAALICPNATLSMRNVCVNPRRTGLLDTLREMGGRITLQNERMVAGEKVADILVEQSTLRGVEVPAERAPSMIDEYPILAVAAAFAHGTTVMRGLSELRVKESDRLSAIAAGLGACGVTARIDGDTLTIQGSGPETPRGGGVVVTHYDHRIAMAFLVFGMASARPVTVDDASAIQTSFPDFARLMNRLGADISPVEPGKRQSARLPSFVIAIDGPAASGKGTLARRLAEHFGLDYLDTGSLYRAVGMKLIYGGADPHNREAAKTAAMTIDEGDLTNPRLRQERIGQAASVVSAYPEVRAALLDFQRRFSKGPRGAVLDGRDIGTVVCPEADFKFFITATLFARAKRRHKELQGQGIEVVFESVLEDLRERDARDEKRSVAPLKASDDAVIIDSSGLDAGHVFEKACQIIAQRLPAAASPAA